MALLYLLDANVLITANNTYYPIDRVPEFWEWLADKTKSGEIKMPLEIFEEVKEGGKDKDKDLLLAWLKDDNLKKTLVLDEEVDVAHVQSVINTGYAPDLTDDQIEFLGRDPFLIAYGLASPSDRVIVTTEVSAPGKKKQNRKVPDVCKTMGVSSCDTFQCLKALNFSTSWKKP